MIDSILSFLSIYWYPIVGFLLVAFTIWWCIQSARDPASIEMMQKADYERAHAYKKGKCCCGKD